MNVITVESEAFQKLFNKLDEIQRSFHEEVAKRERPLSERLLDNDQVCRLLKVSKRTLQSYRDKGIIPFAQFGSKIYYKTEDIETHIEKKLHSQSPLKMYYSQTGFISASDIIWLKYPNPFISLFNEKADKSVSHEIRIEKR